MKATIANLVFVWGGAFVCAFVGTFLAHHLIKNMNPDESDSETK